MFRSMRLRNFRSWEDTGDITLAPITAFFGTNSSGKSSLLRFLLMMKQTVESNDQGIQLELGGRRTYVDLGSMSDLLFAHDPARKLDLSFSWDQATWPAEPPEGGDAAARLTAALVKPISFHTIHALEKSTIRCERMTYEVGDLQFGIDGRGGKYQIVDDGYELQRPRGRPNRITGPIKSYGFPAATRLAYTNAGFLQGFELSLEQAFGNVLYLGPLREDPQRQYTWSGSQPVGVGVRGELVVDALLSARERNEKVKLAPRRFQPVERCVAEWLQRLGLVHEFKVEEVKLGSSIYQVLVRHTKGSEWVPLTDVGFGVSQVLPVLTLCFAAPAGSTLIFEQPEIHLHPAVQAGLADVFIAAMNLRGVQLIIESHSEHFLQRLLRRMAESGNAQLHISEIDPVKVALYFCDKREAASTISTLDVDIFGSIRNWPAGFFGDPLGESIATARAAELKRLQHSA